MRILDCRGDALAESIAHAAEAVTRGELIVMPTDTVYGVACNPSSPEAVSKLLAAKHRGTDMPVPVLVPTVEAALALGERWPAGATALMEAFWPGGMSIVVPQHHELQWNLGVTGGTVMLRMPDTEVGLALLHRTGPLGVSSANITGHLPATSAETAAEQLGDSVSLYLDGGSARIGTASTIVDLTAYPPRIIREGAISAREVAEVLGVTSAELLRR